MHDARAVLLVVAELLVSHAAELIRNQRSIVSTAQSVRFGFEICLVVRIEFITFDSKN